MATTSELMALAVLLFLKHLLADGPLQTTHQVRNKGTFLHPAGLAHSGTHVLFTGICLLGWALAYGKAVTTGLLWLFAGILVAEFLIHYFVDLAKVRVDRLYKWSRVQVGPEGQAVLTIVDNKFFIAFLADQTLHSLTYVAILWILGTPVMGG